MTEGLCTKSQKYLSVRRVDHVLMYNLHDEADVYSVFASVHAELKLSLLQTCCALWYGCQAWQLGTPYCDLMDVEWQKADRKTAGLPRQTRSVMLPGLAGNENFLSQQERRFARLINTMSASNNPAICFLAIRAALSAVGVLVVTKCTLQTSTSAVDSAKASWSLLCAGPSPMKLPEWNRFVSWCVPGMDWRQLAFLNLRISHWYLSS